MTAAGVYTTYLRNATNPAPQAEGYTLLPGRDLQAGNYGCAGSQDNDSATYCRDYGTLQVTQAAVLYVIA